MPSPESSSRLRAEELAATRHGLLRSADLRAAGVTAGTLYRALRSGRWERLQRDVIAVPAPSPVPFELVARAALLSQGCGVIAGDAAACLWGLAGASESSARRAVEIILPESEGRPQRPGVQLSWRRVAAGDLAEHRGLSVTSVPRCLDDLARRRTGEEILPLVDDALRRGLVTATQLRRPASRATVARHPALRALRWGDGRAESVLESRARWWLRDGGLPAPHLQHDVRRPDGSWVARVDLAWPERRLAVELDGFAVHGRPEALRADLDRQNRIVAAGWQVVRFTWADVGRRMLADIGRFLA